MVTRLQLPIVVGLDGTEQGIRAVRFAVREAQRVGCGVRLVHALPELVPMAPMLPLISVETFDQVGHRVANEAKQVAYDMTDGNIQVEKVVRSGSRVHVLVESGEDARLIVLGHRDRSALGRVFTASTSTGVATRAHCPVVTLPTAWAPDSRHGHVVVGVDDASRSHEALATAFVAAAARQARLTVLHAWKLQSPYDDIIASRVNGDEWKASVTAELGEAMGELREAYPAVEVDIDVRHQDPAAALLGATEGADLLVLGRRGHGAPLGFYLGSIARTLIRESRCPVEIIPLTPTHAQASTLEMTLTADELAPQT